MSTAEVKVLKSIDRADSRVNIPLVDDHDFWMTMRHALLQQLAVIEKKLGISRRCPHCGNDVRQRTLG